jgi:hypothetical protein
MRAQAAHVRLDRLEGVGSIPTRVTRDPEALWPERREIEGETP